MKRRLEEFRMSLLLGDENAVMACFLLAAIIIAGLFILYARVDFRSAGEVDAQLDAAFDRGKADADGKVDLMPNRPAWIAKDMRMDEVNTALFEHAGLVCSAQVQSPSAKALTCSRTVQSPQHESRCAMIYGVEAGFDDDRLHWMTGRRTRLCS